MILLQSIGGERVLEVNFGALMHHDDCGENSLDVEHPTCHRARGSPPSSIKRIESKEERTSTHSTLCPLPCNQLTTKFSSELLYCHPCPCPAGRMLKRVRNSLHKMTSAMDSAPPADGTGKC